MPCAPAGLTLLAGAAADLGQGGLEPLVEIESDEFRRLSSTNEFVAAPHIYAMDANNGAEQIAPFHSSYSSAALSMVFHASMPSMAVVTSGCKDPMATNYNSDENILADTSCIYDVRRSAQPPSPFPHTPPTLPPHSLSQTPPHARSRFQPPLMQPSLPHQPRSYPPPRSTVLRLHGSGGGKLQPERDHQ